MKSNNLSLSERQQLFFQTLQRNTPANKREEIYTYAYRARLRESLIEDFPVSIKLGPEFFDKNFDIFCQSPGSRSWSLNHLSSHWFEFIKNQQPLEWLKDLYQFELYRFLQIFISETASKRTLNVFDEMELTATQDFLWFLSDFDLEKIWKTETPPDQRKPSLLLFFRSEDQWTFETVQGNERTILEKLFKDQEIMELPEGTDVHDLEKAFAYLGPLFKTTTK